MEAETHRGERGSVGLGRQTAKWGGGGEQEERKQEGEKQSERTMKTRQNKKELAGSGSLEIH